MPKEDTSFDEWPLSPVVGVGIVAWEGHEVVVAKGPWLAHGLAPLDWVARGVARGGITHSWVPGGGWGQPVIGHWWQLVMWSCAPYLNTLPPYCRYCRYSAGTSLGTVQVILQVFCRYLCRCLSRYSEDTSPSSLKVPHQVLFRYICRYSAGTSPGTLQVPIQVLCRYLHMLS